MMRRIVLTFPGALLGVALALCAAFARADTAPRLIPYRAVLAAGEASIPNFDNATAALATRLRRVGSDAVVLTSDGWKVSAETGYATAWTIDRAIAGVKPDEACLVFVTSHGSTRGLVMAMDNAEHYWLTPQRLAGILARDCGERPTVAILSGCHSGTFLTRPMETANRIILTAARRERTSFGCSADTTYTYFDECLLGALGKPWGAPVTWRMVFDRTTACVAQKEQAQDFEPSDPQAFFGAAVENLGLP
jgi:hypothetical protein